MGIKFSRDKTIKLEHLEKLYNDVEWYAYTNDLDVLQQAVYQSLEVISAWNGDE